MIERFLDDLHKIFSETEATKWANSPEVIEWCEERRKEELSAPAVITPTPNNRPESVQSIMRRFEITGEISD